MMQSALNPIMLFHEAVEFVQGFRLGGVRSNVAAFAHLGLLCMSHGSCI